MYGAATLTAAVARPRVSRRLHGGLVLIGSTEDHGADKAASAAEPDDAALVDRVQRGDVDAFEPLYRRYAGTTYALCLRLTGDRQRAGDLVQDVFVRVWEAVPSFRGDSAFGTWLHRLAVNVVLQELRATRRRTLRIEFADVAELPPIASPTEPIDTRLDLERALPVLPPGARRAFVLHDIEGFSHTEVATLTGLAAGTVRAQVWRARQLLMGVLSR